MTNAQLVRLTAIFGMGRHLLRVVLVSMMAGFMLSAPAQTVNANQEKRTIEQQVQVQVAHWQLLRWSDGFITCNIYINHTGYPTSEEINYACGNRVLQSWLSTPACLPAQSGGSSAGCAGLMMRYVGTQTRIETQTIELPPINLRIYVTNCQPGQWCETRPGLRLVAEEPIDGYEISNVHVRVAHNEKTFPGASIEIRLPPTDEKGDWLEYWAESSFGDSSPQFALKYRAYPSVQQGRQMYRFDLLSDEWANTLPGGALLWQMFPPADGALPKLLEQPLSVGYLTTTNRYALLAGKLIQQGMVDASSCANGGLLSNGAASACGERVAADLVLAWQNRYDQQIYEAALRHNIPARVIKGIIAQESQFWPESSDPYERGLGFITENGVAMLLLWNLEYYASVCVPIYGMEGCAAGYASLRADRQIIIRRAVFDRIGSDAEIDLIAAMLYASAAQTKQLVKNVTRAEPADVTSYEEMWKMTIANYYAGSGCLGNALRASLNETYPLTWDVLSTYLEGTCVIAKDYVWRVMHYSE